MQTKPILRIRVRSLSALAFAVCCGGCISVHQTKVRSPIPHPPIQIVEKSDELVVELKPRLDVNFDHELETAVDRSEVDNTTWQLPKAQIGLDGTLSLSAVQLSAGLGYARIEQEGYPSGTIELGARPGSRGNYAGVGFRWRKSWSETDYTYSAPGFIGAEPEKERVLRQASDYVKDLYLHLSHSAPAWGQDGGYFLSIELGYLFVLDFQESHGDDIAHAKRMGSMAVGAYRNIDPSRRVVGGLRVTRFADRNLPEIVAQVDWKVGRLKLKQGR